MPEVGRRVQQVRAVADHAHVLKRAGHPFLIGLRQEVVALPLADDAGNDFPVLVVVDLLLRGHGDEQVLVQPAGQFRQHLRLGPPQQDRLQGFGDPGEVAIADDPPVVVKLLVLGEEAKRRPEAKTVHELHDRVQLFEAVLQRRAGQHDRVLRRELLDRPRGARLPVLDALRFVQNDQVRPPAMDRFQVAMQHFVVDDFEERVGLVEALAGGGEALDDDGVAGGELLDFLFPLVLERGGCDDEDAFDAGGRGEDFRRRQRLDRLAQPHVVRQQRPPRPRREKRTAPLVRIEPHLQKVVECRAVLLFGELLFDPRRQRLAVAELRHELHGVVVAAHLVPVAADLFHKLFEPLERLRTQDVVVAKVRLDAPGAVGRKLIPAAQGHFAAGTVAQVDFRKRRAVPPRQRPFPPPPAAPGATARTRCACTSPGC